MLLMITYIAQADCRLAILQSESSAKGTARFRLQVHCDQAKLPLQYQLTLNKHGKSGRTTSSQSGYFNSTGEVQVIGNVGINLTGDDRVEVVGKVLHQSRLLARTEKTFP
ncbi:hypothetical protein A11A3_02207 [Alcanivorax hongdengensis A-11-3]|uniref:Curli assembly protein CsgC n=2 Tax=Alcanivorax hongdengensis TaxID=519051 RepID=L0WG00_9GAMM|nr:hypothetical protein A11A3_02207 [Alcanivorax hongdengensis A-11-3]